ncbi:MAG: Motility protein B [Alphaproteobacteria bacterium ADurb.Bin438]|nr:MAG: Motility protein B [Alphaproteobacteria bacterium ADurb.Bin438]
MFPLGSNIMTDNAEKLLLLVSRVIKKMPNKISISGHTDSVPFVSPSGYGNWELSADRSLATMRKLITLGINPDKVMKIVGFEDNDPYVKSDANHPNNRRISITLLREHPLIEIKNINEEKPARKPRRDKPVNPFTRK